MQHTKKAFSFVEIIITISILALLAIIGIASNMGYEDNKINAKVSSDLMTINNGLESYKTQNAELPEPLGNQNFFNQDTSYAHSGATAFGVYGFVTEDLLPKQYLDVLPLDPKTNQYYAYGKTINGIQYELAGVNWVEGDPKSFVQGNYTAEVGPYNLIREYNGPDFVYNKSTSNFPYNPWERVISAKIVDFTAGQVTLNGGDITETGAILEHDLQAGDTIEVQAGAFAEIYFSDGSISTLGDSTQVSTLTLSDLDFIQEDNLYTRIKLALGAGTIWTKATKLGAQSEFEIYTTDSTAAVRGTIFGVQKNTTSTVVSVTEGLVEVVEGDTEEMTPEAIIDIIPVEVNPGETKIIQNGGSAVTSSEVITYEDYGNINNTIQPEVLSYKKDATSIEIKIALNDIFRNADFLALSVDSGENVFIKNTNHNWTQKDVLTLTGSSLIDTVISGNNTFGILIEGKSKLSLAFGEDTVSGKRYSREKDIQLVDSSYSINDNGEVILTQTCSTFMVGPNLDECAEDTLNEDGYKLVAYAPYNTAGDLKLYQLNNGPISPEHGKILFSADTSSSDMTALPSICTGTRSDVSNSFCESSDGTKGVFIDNDGNNDFIKYSLPETLSGSYAIEISIEKNALLEDGTKFIYSTNTQGLLSQYNGTLIKLNGGNVCTPTLGCGILNKTFETITNINGKKFSVGGSSFGLNESNELSIDDLYIGSTPSSTLQVNGIINYIKIYK